MEDRSGFFFRVGKDDTLLQDIMTFFQQQGRGKLSRALRDGLRLVWDLSHQRTDVLIELFPFVTEALCAPPSNNEDVLRELAALRKEIREQKLAPSHEIPDVRQHGIPAMKQAGQGIGTLASRTVELPRFDDDDELPQMTMKLSPLSSAKNGSNLIAGILGLD